MSTVPDALQRHMRSHTEHRRATASLKIIQVGAAYQRVSESLAADAMVIRNETLRAVAENPGRNAHDRPDFHKPSTYSNLSCTRIMNAAGTPLYFQPPPEQGGLK